MPAIKPGVRLRSVVSDAEVVVVKAAGSDIGLTCGGRPMVALADGPTGAAEQVAGEGEALLGKRYVDEELGVEVLCTKPGKGQLAVNGRALILQGAKPLPASD